MRMQSKEEVDHSVEQTSLGVFLKTYNSNLPVGFPKATVSILRKFQSIYPTLFKNGNTWSVALCRKKVIDWLSSYRNAHR